MPEADRQTEIAESLDALTESPAWYLFVQVVRKYYNPTAFQQRIESISAAGGGGPEEQVAIAKVVAAHGMAEELLALPAQEAAMLRKSAESEPEEEESYI